MNNMKNIENLNTSIIKHLIKELKHYLTGIHYHEYTGCDKLINYYKGISISKTFINKGYDEKNILEGDFNLSFGDACIMIEVINNYSLQNEDFIECFNLSNEHWVFNNYCYVYSRILFNDLKIAEYNEVNDTDSYLLSFNNLSSLMELKNIFQKIKNVYIINARKMLNKPLYKLCNKYINNINKKKTITKVLNNSILTSDIIDKINTY